jgi:broad specificity phosphatase PhoE
MRIYITRHGESEANIFHIISNRELPHPLTEKGRLQATALAEKLRGKSIIRIYTSPIRRARETAEILSAELGVPMECVDALREPDCGVLEGRGDEAAWKEHDYWKESWFFGREEDSGPQGGETCQDVRRRLAGFIAELINRFGETESEFLLVTHGALLLYGLPGVLTDIDNQFVLEHGLGYTLLISTEVLAGRLVYSKGR